MMPGEFAEMSLAIKSAFGEPLNTKARRTFLTFNLIRLC